MFKLLKNLRKRDWVLILVILGLTFLQVFCTMTWTDMIQKLTQVITYISNQKEYFNAENLIPLFTAGNLTYNTDLSGPKNVLENLESVSQMFHIESSTLNEMCSVTTSDIWLNALFMILIALGLVLCQAVIALISSYITANMANTIRAKMNDKISSFSLAEINKFSISSLITRETNDVMQYQMTILMALRMLFSAPITAVWAILKINTVSFKLMIPTLVGIVLLVAFLICLMIYVLPKFKVSQKLLDKLNGITRENISGIRVVRAYNAETYQQDKFEDTNKSLTKIQTTTGAAMASLSCVITLIMNGISVALYWIGSIMINDPAETLDYPQILSFMMLSSQIVMSFMMLLMMFVMMPRAAISANRIVEVLQTEPSIKDPEVEKERTCTGKITFNDVSFSYPDSDSNVVENLTFEIEQGQTLALIGETGCGKTTIVNLLTRSYDSTNGEIDIDGVNIKDLKQNTLHSLLGVVPQKGFLFSGSVKENIKLGNESLNDEQVKSICEIAEADSFIQEMPAGYDSDIGQGGKNVSGGQRQRLCIARALATQPEILVFDDSFSALDFKTDKKIRENLENNCKNMTKVIVAQRIGTIMNADKIIVLNEGKIVGQGTHKELLANCQTYKDIALSQLSKEELGL